jgi:hypothetical protein
MNLDELKPRLAAQFGGASIDITGISITDGEIRLKYRKQGAVGTPVTVARQADMDDDKAFILAALRDAQEKMQRPFIGLAWFRDKYVPMLGTNMDGVRIQQAITELIVQGGIVLDKVESANSARPLSAIRTPDMPVSQSNLIREVSH